jgi:hypothetical protein
MPDRTDNLDPVIRLLLARRRQELLMRWILLTTIVSSVLISSATTLVYGPPSLHFALVQGTWATMLGWLTRRLFGPSGS